MAIKKLSKKRSARTEARRSRRMSRMRGRIARKRMDNKKPVTPSRPARRARAAREADEGRLLAYAAPRPDGSSFPIGGSSSEDVEHPRRPAPRDAVDPGDTRLWG